MEYSEIYLGKEKRHTENYMEDAMQTMLHKLEPYKDKVQFIRKKSEDAVADIKEAVDFIYIDGNHDYEFVKKDIGLYWKLLKPKGIIAGHDFKHYSVAKAVVEFCNRNNLNASNWLLDWHIIKPEK